MSEFVRRWMDVPVVTMAGYVSIFAIAFGNLIDLETDNDTVSIAGQAFVKVMFLAIAGIYGGVGLLTDARVRKVVLSFPMMWMVLLVGFYCISVLASPIKLESLASTMSIACVLLMTVTGLVQLGVRNVLQTVFAAMSMYILFSWFTFLLVPSIGVFYEPTVDGQTVARMGGLAHPNVLGQMSGLTLVMALLIYHLDPSLSRIKMLVLVVAAAALVFSMSRTSLLATIVAVSVFYRSHIFRRQYLIWVLTFGSILLLFVLAAAVVFDLESAIASRLGMFSKSGDPDELFSATGRTQIWAYALHLIGEQPLTGYGAATTKIYLADYSFHCHNLVLNIAFSTGVFGGLIALWMCLERTFRLFVYRHPIADALVVFILVNGIFENVIFSILAGLPTMIWTIGLCIPLLKDDEANRQMFDRDRQIEEDYLNRQSAPRTWSLQR
ncbi:MAG: O-antigen ligase family protein [Planctomycetota bacterium]